MAIGHEGVGRATEVGLSTTEGSERGQQPGGAVLRFGEIDDSPGPRETGVFLRVKTTVDDQDRLYVVVREPLERYGPGIETAAGPLSFVWPTNYRTLDYTEASADGQQVVRIRLRPVDPEDGQTSAPAYSVARWSEHGDPDNRDGFEEVGKMGAAAATTYIVTLAFPGPYSGPRYRDPPPYSYLDTQRRQKPPRDRTIPIDERLRSADWILQEESRKYETTTEKAAETTTATKPRLRERLLRRLGRTGAAKTSPDVADDAMSKSNSSDSSSHTPRQTDPTPQRLRKEQTKNDHGPNNTRSPGRSGRALVGAAVLGAAATAALAGGGNHTTAPQPTTAPTTVTNHNASIIPPIIALPPPARTAMQAVPTHHHPVTQHKHTTTPPSTAAPAPASKSTPQPNLSPWEAAARDVGPNNAMGLVKETISSIDTLYAAQPSQQLHLAFVNGVWQVYHNNNTALNKAEQRRFDQQIQKVDAKQLGQAA